MKPFDRHPGTSKPIHTSHGGSDHSHVHTKFHAPKPRSQNPSHFQRNTLAQSAATQPKQVIPTGTYGPDTSTSDAEGQSPDDTQDTQDTADASGQDESYEPEVT